MNCPWCTDPPFKSGMCARHYQRWTRSGKPDKASWDGRIIPLPYGPLDVQGAIDRLKGENPELAALMIRARARYWAARERSNTRDQGL